MNDLLWKKPLNFHSERWLFAESVENIAKVSKKKKLGDFSLQNDVALKEETKYSPDFIIAGLWDTWQKRQAIRWEFFFNNILLPLESKNDDLIKFLRQSADTHVPFLLKLCGLPMSNATCDERTAIADRFWKALINSDVIITLASIKSRLAAFIENEQTFDVLETLKEVETMFSLQSDAELFTLFLQELSLTDGIKAVDSMIMEIQRRKLPVSMDMKAIQIYCYLKESISSAEKLAYDAVSEYGNDIIPLILKARCRAAIEKNEIEHFLSLFDSMFSLDSKLILFADEMTLEFVWLLARNSNDSLGKEHEKLYTEMLRKTRKGPGFFKLMVREAERHALHGLFYSALSYFHYSLHPVTKKSKTNFGRHFDWVVCLSKAIIDADLPIAEMKDLFVYISQNVLHERFLLERILFCLLTRQRCSNDRRLQITLELLKILDVKCSKVHIIIPLLVRASSVEEYLNIVAHFVASGYTDFNHLNFDIVRKLLLYPLLKNDGISENTEWTTEHLIRIVDIFTKHNVSKEIAYKLLESVTIKNNSLTEWLKKQSNQNGASSNDCGEISLNLLESYLSNEKVDKVQEMVKKIGLKRISAQLFRSIIMLCIRKADWNTLMEFIKWIRAEDNSSNTHLSVDNVLMILARHLEDFKHLNETSSFVYQLQQFVPHGLHHSNIRNQKVVKKLVEKCIELPHENVNSLIACSQLFRIIANINWVQSGSYENISPSFVAIALAKYGFKDALIVCSSFQFSNFPNGIIYLLHQAARMNNRNYLNSAVALAKTFWPEWKVSVISAAVMISLDKLDEANSYLQKASIRWVNVLHAYQLLCGFHFDETRYFHFNYLDLFSKIIGYDRNDENCIRLTLGCLKNCVRKDPDQAYSLKFLLRRYSVDSMMLQKKLGRFR